MSTVSAARVDDVRPGGVVDQLADHPPDGDVLVVVLDRVRLLVVVASTTFVDPVVVDVAAGRDEEADEGGPVAQVARDRPPRTRGWRRTAARSAPRTRCRDPPAVGPEPPVEHLAPPVLGLAREARQPDRDPDLARGRRPRWARAIATSSVRVHRPQGTGRRRASGRSQTLDWPLAVDRRQRSTTRRRRAACGNGRTDRASRRGRSTPASDPTPSTHAHNTPIYATATFAFDTAAEKEDAVDRALAWDPTAYFYSRTGNPTNRALEEKIASLEGAEDCVVSASGMASVAATLFAHARRRATTSSSATSCSRSPTVLLEDDLPRRGIGVTAVDTTDLAAVEAAITPATRLALPRVAPRTRGCGSPTSTRSPTLGHRHGLIVIADNTFLGPALLRPLEHGADLVLHAATKYLSGHGDAVSGVVSGPQGADRPDPAPDRHLRPGGEPVRELPRPARRSDAAAALGAPGRRTRPRLAAFLEADPRSSGSATRGLPRTRTTRSRARLLGDRFGAMVTFKPRGGVDGDGRVHRPPRGCATSASAWATCHTLVYPQPKRGGLIRVSVGCEDIEDLLADFELGLSFVA